MLDKAQGGDGAKLVVLAREATRAAEAVLADAALAVRRRVTADDRMVDALLDRLATQLDATDPERRPE